MSVVNSLGSKKSDLGFRRDYKKFERKILNTNINDRKIFIYIIFHNPVLSFMGKRGDGFLLIPMLIKP